MIQSVIQALLVHLMSYPKIPKTVSHSLEKGVRKFYWGGNQINKKMHWVNWDILCLRKLEGDIGLRKSFLFNQAILAKQAWHMITNPQFLVAKLFKELYHPDDTLLHARKRNGTSPY